MKAVRFNAATSQLVLEKAAPIPKSLPPGQVLVKVAFAGICGTDLHIIEGSFPCKADGPVTLGHEFSGTVVEVGTGVDHLRKGDRVSVDPNSGCMCCKECLSGSPHFCATGGLDSTVGIYKDGGWAEYCVVAKSQVLKIPDSIELRQGALCEPMSCLSHGWDRVSPLHVGQRVLITGAGIIGNLWASLLHLQGHRKVTISEPIEARRSLAKGMGFGYDVLSPNQVKARRIEAGDAFSFDLVVDCSGNAAAIEDGFRLLAKGGKLCVFGVAAPEAVIKISPHDVFKKELSVLGVVINPHSFVNAIGYIEAMGEAYLDYARLGIKTYRLDDYQEAIAALKTGQIAKAVFEM